MEGVPAATVDDLVIANVPEDNSLTLQASLEALPGGTLSLPVKIANRDSVGSGPNSFTLAYDSAVLTQITSITAGARAGGSSFNFTVADATMLAAAKKATVTFSGGTIPTGAAGTLCTVNFSIAQVASGTSASVTLAGVSLKSPAGAALAVVDPTTPTSSLTFFAGDSLSFGSMQGEGAAIIMDGQLHVPIVLKNTVAVSLLDFYIQEPTGKDSVLTLAASPIAHVNRATNWMVSAADSGRYVHVIAMDPYGAGSIAAGSGSLFHVVYDIHLAAGDVPAQGGTPYNLDLAFKGVRLVDGSGSSIGIKTVAGIASLDYRVPLGGEAVDQGASLPKAFALAQNHPNPFNPSTTINYQIPDDVGSINISLNVYDIRGRLVRTLAEGLKGAGSYSTFWDGTDNSGRQVGSGVYFYRFSSSKFNATRKMILLK
ncbi:MAG: FlgD immunoglobulin-like domain containing protein [Candidatus Glassbacteria bacterium]